jgi:membrane protein YdbS with pleckstrin-like domain
VTPASTPSETPKAHPAPSSAAPLAARRAIADGAERKLDPRSITVNRLVGAAWTAVLAAVSLVALAIFSFVGPLGATADLGLLACWFVAFGLLSASTWFLPAMRWKHASYRVDENGIQIRHGVWWRSVVDVPKSRVQHTDVSQGPVERNFGLGTLVIHTAGTQNASVPLGGLTREDASAIRDHLIEGGEGDAV